MPHGSGIYYLPQVDQGLCGVKSVMGFTFLAEATWRSVALAYFAAPAPGIGRDAKALQHQVGRRDEQPGNAIGGDEFLPDSAEKLPKSVATVISEDHLSDKINDSRHQNDSGHEQDEQENCFLADRY